MGAIGRITTQVFALRLPRFLGLVVFMYVGAWLVSFAAGGASTVPPHAFYVPIAVVGIKLGIRGAVVAGVVAALVAGPALPADVSTGVAQAMSEWVSRGVFFVAVGATVTHLTNAAVGTVLATAEREAELLHAVEADQLVVHYQPVVRIDTGVVVGAEALVRWAHPTRGLVGPSDFVPFAEERGIICAIGHWVLQRSITDMHEWKDTPGIENLPIRELAINVSRRQFCEGTRLLDQLDDLIRDRPLPIQLVVEVTETALADNSALLTDSLTDLKRRGVEVAIDDFGTGQSSVAAVRDLPIDIIKIDKTFVDGLTTDSNDRQIVATRLRWRTAWERARSPKGSKRPSRSTRSSPSACGWRRDTCSAGRCRSRSFAVGSPTARRGHRGGATDVSSWSTTGGPTAPTSSTSSRTSARSTSPPTVSMPSSCSSVRRSPSCCSTSTCQE